MDGSTNSDGPALYLPQKTVGLAIGAELRLARFYRESANRLRPFDLGISHLLDMLVLEREQQRRELGSLAQAMFGALRIVSGPCRRRARYPAIDHFFVLSPNDATALMGRAVRFERCAGRFHNRCAALERVPQLHQLYRRFSESDGKRAEVLEEAIEGLGMQPLAGTISA
ncbi:MAG: hypothetical protein DWQ09_14220 [Proteobacteria bacterium]|nr:MAG: hypothetical protein DWQ09_14220 [Pseudomonadota bacterium]QKK10418.1 MAG: hypothetical protein HND59_01095 [Pseudomonadota bacterium]